MPAITLRTHPATPCPAISECEVRYERSPTGLLSLDYRLEGAVEELRIPGGNPAPGRRDELWRHTCFEVFIAQGEDPDYWECNFSPAGDWAIYHFTAYRDGMNAPPLASPPLITAERDTRHLILRVALDTGALVPGFSPWGELRLAISAVLESRNGAHSYWALRHPPGNPDFHHPESFALNLPA